MGKFNEYRTYDFDLTDTEDSKVKELEDEFDKIKKKLGTEWRCLDGEN